MNISYMWTTLTSVNLLLYQVSGTMLLRHIKMHAECEAAKHLKSQFQNFNR